MKTWQQFNEDVDSYARDKEAYEKQTAASGRLESRRSDSTYYWNRPGYRAHPHRVESYRHRRPGNYYREDHVDDNSCVEGTVIGGILGGGLAAGVSKSDAYAWSIPLGVVGGALVGCQVDGG